MMKKRRGDELKNDMDSNRFSNADANVGSDLECGGKIWGEEGTGFGNGNEFSAVESDCGENNRTSSAAGSCAIVKEKLTRISTTKVEEVNESSGSEWTE